MHMWKEFFEHTAANEEVSSTKQQQIPRCSLIFDLAHVTSPITLNSIKRGPNDFGDSAPQSTPILRLFNFRLTIASPEMISKDFL